MAAHRLEDPHGVADHAKAALARTAVAALGIREGPSVTRIRVDPDGPKVLDVHAGLGDPDEVAACHAELGIDLNALALSSALGEPISERRLRPRRAGAEYVRFPAADAQVV